MKKLLGLFALLVSLSTFAQSTNAPNAPAVKPQESFQAQAAARAKETPAELRQAKPNEIINGKVTYSGILVEAAKTRAPLQLLNPAAPAQYGSPEDNLVRDPMNGRITGLKFFSLRF